MMCLRTPDTVSAPVQQSSSRNSSDEREASVRWLTYATGR